MSPCSLYSCFLFICISTLICNIVVAQKATLNGGYLQDNSGYTFCYLCLLFDLFDEMSSLCVCHRFAHQDLMLLRDLRVILLWKDEGLQSPVQNSKYFAALLLSSCVSKQRVQN